MGDRPILSVIHAITIGIMLYFNNRQNLSLKYRTKFRYVWTRFYPLGTPLPLITVIVFIFLRDGSIHSTVSAATHTGSTGRCHTGRVTPLVTVTDWECAGPA